LIDRFTPLLLTAGILIAPTPASTQEYVFESDGESAKVVAREGSVLVVEAEGPPLVRTGPITVEHGSLRNRWIVVQDSTMGVVFTEPSGVKMNSVDFDGDIDLRALRRVVAVEVRALLFNVWGDFVGQVSATRLVETSLGHAWAMDPRWIDLRGPPSEHRASVMWVHRVMFSDESVLEADLGVVRSAAEPLGGGPSFDFGPITSALPGR
jgi:hypothetical protein